mmetsp:Transcript_128527/g.357800  ORF Transcript_128527/g.357800 Transcript_128527/m.357800 type:complete len:277 (-) Transcript_128527:293-1123(-)
MEGSTALTAKSVSVDPSILPDRRLRIDLAAMREQPVASATSSVARPKAQPASIAATATATAARYTLRRRSPCSPPPQSSMQQSSTNAAEVVWVDSGSRPSREGTPCSGSISPGAASANSKTKSERNHMTRAAVFRHIPMSTGVSITCMKPTKVIPRLILAMRAFCGFPMMVRALPMLQLMLMPNRKGNALRALCLRHRLMTMGVSTRHIVSFRRNADITAETPQIFRSIITGDGESNIICIFLHMPVSLRYAFTRKSPKSRAMGVGSTLLKILIVA